ncbi:mechanosensitive ion channel domain-containing protein [Arthrobacter sp. HY1533]|uniref:mechanosensitive ion channel domain-containing protein n=1 Tax=Arthrobacter sp. HY1533 TaxID=2970919 RepID=UPI0022BA0CE6|nr:mechanosensitive ion channel domain-containing protein [Arthrobacter sp. HY1533]
MGDAFQDGWAWWVLALAIGVPVLLVVLTETLSTLSRKNSPLAGPVRLLRNWVVPAGAVLGLLAFAMQSPAEQVWVRVVATVFGFLVILLVLSSFNVALFANASPGSWRDRIPTIFIELARLVLVVVGLAVLFSWVWKADVGGLFAALGVTSIVIGLALQNAVGGVISGLLLLFEQPFKIGDWLDTGSVTGRVVEVNWRAVHIDTGAGIQIVPNSTLSGASFTNLSEPAGPYSTGATVAFSTDDPPHEVLALLVDVGNSLPMLAVGHQVTANYLGSAKYTVSIPVHGPSAAGEALSVYMSWLWYAARRNGLALDGDCTDPLADPARLAAAVKIAAPSLHLGDHDHEPVVSSARLERYGIGEVVLTSGTVPDQVLLVVSGRASHALEIDGGRIEFAHAEPGEMIGQTALTRERTQAVTVAADVLTLLVIPLATIDALISRSPMLATEIGGSLELKRQLADEALAVRGITRRQLSER